MEISNQEQSTSALQRKAAKLHQNPDLAMPESKKLKAMPERKNRASKSRKRSVSDQQHCGEIEGEETDRAEVESKIVALQRIVPGGEELGVDKLFEETAEYILSLHAR